MRRNPAIISHILGCLERKPDLQSMHASELKTGKISQAEIIYHLSLLDDAGLVVAYNSEYEPGLTPREVLRDSVSRLTWAGHEWLEQQVK